MKKVAMKLSIIIVSYNTKDILDECLASIYDSQINDSFEIIVVDNCSKDGTIELIEENISVPLKWDELNN